MRLPRIGFSVEWVSVPLRFSMRQMVVAVAVVAIGLAASAPMCKGRGGSRVPAT